jgi:hypothetical protein
MVTLNIIGFSPNLTGYGTFDLYLVIRTRVFMYATTAGVMIGLGVLLFIVRGRRSKGVKATISGHEIIPRLKFFYITKY